MELNTSTGDEGINEEVEDRLDNLFGEEGSSDAIIKEDVEPEDSPLRELKTIVLSIDWEITDEVMTSFVSQIKVMKEKYSGDKIILVFLQLLGSLGAYIKINKGQSHPDTFKILNSLFNNLDKIFRSPDLAESEKKKILAIELAKYKNLKERLVKTEPKEEKEEPVKPVDEVKKERIDLQDLLAAVEDLKKLIKTEFEALRAELKSLK
jgi:hypothetical protein